VTAYTLDTNILINMNRLYPRDIFPTLWGNLEDLVDVDWACICSEVLVEVKRGGDDLHKWARDLAGFVCDITANEPITVAAISAGHPDWVRGTVNAADPWLIAHAIAHDRAIVSEEREAGPGVADRNQKVPNVAAENGVECIKFFEFARRQTWQF
jgi:hypothetical protein